MENIFLSYFNSIKSLINYGDYKRLTKRVIDLTLDTGEIKCYKETLHLLDWLDKERTEEERKARFESHLDYLARILEKKPFLRTTDTPLVSVRNLVRSYRKSGFSLGPVSFDLTEGKLIGLVGENGNGKTTLLRTLCGELKPSGGELNYSFSKARGYNLRPYLIYIPQRTDSWKGTLLSNLQYTAAFYGVTGKENEYLVQLIIARMGLREYRTYSWKNLSSGYKMRFELARALLRCPGILLIDEPLANLDIVAQQIILDDFRDIAQSPFRPLGIILSSQQLYEVEKTSDQVIFLKNGMPRNLHNETDHSATEVTGFMVEFESAWEQSRLQRIFIPIGLVDIQRNGGTYIATFRPAVTIEIFLKTCLDNNIPLAYYRNITHSTRRFFLS